MQATFEIESHSIERERRDRQTEIDLLTDILTDKRIERNTED